MALEQDCSGPEIGESVDWNDVSSTFILDQVLKTECLIDFVNFLQNNNS